MAIVVEHLGKSFGSVRAVDDVSFEVPDGLVTGFLGPNGAGKSTAMRLMVGLDRGEGVTRFDGRPLEEHRPAATAVGAHLDARPFLPGRTARAHLRMLAASAGISAARVDEVLGLVGLTEVAGKRPRGFSLGMAQRLALAGAILAEPAALILDEPANGLDPQSIQWLREFLRAYAAGGRAVLVSSHLLSEMQLMADRIVVIARGRVVASGALADIVEARGDVLVRCADRSRLAEALAGRGIETRAEGEDGLAVAGVDTDAVGAIAFESGIAIRELTQRSASLEEVFLELTGGEQQFAFGGGA